VQQQGGTWEVDHDAQQINVEWHDVRNAMARES
jgi:hypothetical protein